MNTHCGGADVGSHQVSSSQCFYDVAEVEAEEAKLRDSAGDLKGVFTLRKFGKIRTNRHGPL